MRQDLVIGTITLDWHEWVPWADDRKAVIPAVGGVYEVMYLDSPDSHRLYIGEGRDIQRRVFEGMIRNDKHPAGDIAFMEDVSRVRVRWAATSRHLAAEEELIRAYQEQFGGCPHTRSASVD